MKTLDVKFVSLEVDNNSVVVKTMPTSFIVCKDNQVLHDKEQSH